MVGAWAHYLMQRLDNMYMTRVSDAPLLKEKPSHYMRRMFYCSQPPERPENPAALAVAFDSINAEGLQLSVARFRRAGDDLGSAVPVRGCHEGDPRRQRPAAVLDQAGGRMINPPASCAPWR